MATQLELAKAGIVTEEMKKAVEGEPISAEELRDLIAARLAVLPKNGLVRYDLMVSSYFMIL